MRLRRLLWLVPQILLLTLCGNAQAQFTFTTNNGTITITGYTGPGGDVIIPSTINGLPVTGIGEWAFYDSPVPNVLIPDSVTNIADGAFFDCASLTNVTVGDKVMSLGDWTFASCSNLTSACFRGDAPSLGGTNVFYGCRGTVYYLQGTTDWGSTLGGRPAVLWNPPVPFTYTTNNETITITGYTGSGGSVAMPGRINFLPVTSIGEWAFYDTSVTNVLIPDSVTNIADGAFFDCASLTNVTVGDKVMSLGDWTFAFCSNLTSVCFRGDAPSLGGASVFYGCGATNYYLWAGANWGSTLGGRPAVLWNPPVPFTYTTNNEAITITEYTGSGGSVAIPGRINFLPVTSIGGTAFYKCANLTSVTIPNSVTDIGQYAFEICTNLTNVSLGSGVTSIGTFAFLSCTSLTNLAVDPLDLFYSSVNGVLFDKSQASLIQYPSGVAGPYTIPDSVTSIGDYAFYSRENLTEVTIPNSVTTIGYAAFASCTGLTNVSIGDGVTNIGQGAFYLCTRLTSIMIPDSVTSIGSGAFEYCTSLTNIIIPNRVTSIASYAFSNCTNLTDVAIPSSVTSIGDCAFLFCTSLTSITIPSTVTNIEDQAFWVCTCLRSIFFKGNAPGLGFSPFQYDNAATIYYLSGTAGWDRWASPPPAVLWNPTIQTADPNFGVQNNQLGFSITGTTNIPIAVVACTNPANPTWVPLQTCTLTNGSIYFSDPQWTNYPARFYRIRSP
jgi:hypothetical protein